MLRNTIMTQIELRLELISLELQSLNDRSVKNKVLNDIIAYCVPRKYLEGYTIYGMIGDQAHLRIEIEIDYEEHEQQVKLSGDGLSDDAVDHFALGDGPDEGRGGASTRGRHCPHMGKALGLYMHLAKNKGMRLHWSVRFREKREEMCEKFGLGPAIIRDCTTDGSTNRITNSELPEVSMTGRVSEQGAPAR